MAATDRTRCYAQQNSLQRFVRVSKAREYTTRAILADL